MIVLIETSAVLRWLFNESQGDEALLVMQEADKVLTSRLTLIEVGRVVSRAVREYRIDRKQAEEVVRTFRRAAASWAVVEILGEVAGRAAESFPVEPVRALDAIHLATAIVMQRDFPSIGVTSLDDRIRNNAAQLGLIVLP